MTTDHSLRPRAKQMFLVIENYLNSQSFRKVFCQQHGIIIQLFGYPDPQFIRTLVQDQ